MSTKNLDERIKLTLSPLDKEKIYDELLDEAGEIEIAGRTFDRSWIIKKLDPIAYECGLNDYFDLFSDIYYELDGEYYWQDDINELKVGIENESKKSK